MSLRRAGDRFELAFARDDELNHRVSRLAYAEFDPGRGVWSCAVCEQTLDDLRRMYYEGLLDVAPDELLSPGEQPPSVAPAVVRDGSRTRPFVVYPSTRDEQLFSRLRAAPGAYWDRRAKAMTYPPNAAAALSDLVERGVVDDPDGLLQPSDVTVMFDGASGRFTVRGDPRAQRAFDEHFPSVDAVAEWGSRGIDVDFSDDFTREVYRGELARHGDGVNPAGLAVDLFPFQQQDVAYILERTGCLVANEPGLGKTATAVAAGWEMLANREEVPRVVVVCPASVRTHWAREIHRFTGDHAVVVDGDATARRQRYAEAQQSRWLVVHYDVLHRDADHLLPLSRGALLVGDEAHHCKNLRAQRSQRMRDMSRAAHRRLMLTGTPVESRPDEWYAVLGVLAVPGILGKWGEFASRYMYKSRWGGYHGSRNLSELFSRSAPHFVRRRKRDVAAHLPELRVRKVALDPDPGLAQALRRAHQQARGEIAAHWSDQRGGATFDGLEAVAELTSVSILRQLSSSPRLVSSSDSEAAKALIDAGVIPDTDGPKLDELRALCHALSRSGERVVVFTFSKRMADLICERLDADGVTAVRYTGGMTTTDRDEAVRRFTDCDDDVTAFVATDAAAEGLSLGTCCSTLVNFDVPWTPTRLEQRSNRIHRIDGAARQYEVINMTITGTIEEQVLAKVSRKADIVDAIFGEKGGRARTVGSSRVTAREVLSELLADGDETDLTLTPTLAAPPRPRGGSGGTAPPPPEPDDDTGPPGTPAEPAPVEDLDEGGLLTWPTT